MSARARPLVVAVLLALTACGREPLSPELPMATTVGDLVHAPWEVVQAHPDAAPHADLICPATSWRVDGGELAALVLPPPAEVRLVVPDPPGEGLLHLEVRAGFDRHMRAKHLGDLTGVRAEVSLHADGRELLHATFALDDDGARRWLGPTDGAPRVDPGQTLVARTRLLDANDRPVQLDQPLKIGLGELALVRRTSRPRVRSAPARPNVVLIVLDTVRADRTSLMGYARPTTPHLEALAARGLLHAGALTTSSWTWPSTASLLTGLQPLEHGVLDGSACFLADELVSLPERLQRLGFTTAAWSGNPLIGPSRNFDQGFETFEAARGRMRSSADMLPEIEAWLERVAGTRFFLYVQLMDAHAPHQPRAEDRARFAADVPEDFPAQFLTTARERLLAGEGRAPDGSLRLDEVVTPAERAHVSDLYDACVASADARVGALLGALDDLDLTDETLVIVTTDHGEELFDHGLAGHGHSLHPELVDSFVVLAGPGVPVGERVDVPVSNRHIAATLLAFVGDEPGGLPVRDGLDLLGPARDLAGRRVYHATESGWWNGRHPQPLHGVVLPGVGQLQRAPRGGPWGGEPAPDGDWAFLGADTSDTDAASLVHELDAWAAERAARSPRGQAAGDRTLEMLRALGYVSDDGNDDP